MNQLSLRTSTSLHLHVQYVGTWQQMQNPSLQPLITHWIHSEISKALGIFLMSSPRIRLKDCKATVQSAIIREGGKTYVVISSKSIAHARLDDKLAVCLAI